MSRAPDTGARGYLWALLPWSRWGPERLVDTRYKALPGLRVVQSLFLCRSRGRAKPPLVVVGAGRLGAARLWWELCLISHAGQRCGLSKVQRRSQPPCSRSRTLRTPAAYRNPLSRSWFRGRGLRRGGCTPGISVRPRCRSLRSFGRGRPTGIAVRTRRHRAARSAGNGPWVSYGAPISSNDLLSGRFVT